MTIREATIADVPAIVQLLKLSLGDISTTKSAEYWRWKHIDNPFGSSYVLLAEEGEQLIGVRAFMRWAWTDGTQTYRALRAVDTATHPDHRGKGIFKKLTLELLKRREAAGDDFVFNTPNDQSRPGYIKMGWEAVGRLPVRLAVRRPLRAIRNRLLGHNPESAQAKRDSGIDLSDQYCMEDVSVGQKNWRRATPENYYRWRYLDCPVADYVLIYQPQAYFIVVHPKSSSYGIEFRVVDEVIEEGMLLNARRAFKTRAREYGATLLSASPQSNLPTLGWFGLKAGPLLTYRRLNGPPPPTPPEWGYTLGDMELF